MANSGSWVPYTGSEAILLAVVLVAVAAVFAFLGTRLRIPLGAKIPGKPVILALVAIWLLSILTLTINTIAYAVQLVNDKLVATYRANTLPNPITPITDAGAVVTFVIILLLLRKNGWKAALVGAFVGTAVAPMIFELPFDLVVLNRIIPPLPPSPILYRLIFFLPLFLIEISTFSFLTFSSHTKVTKYTLYCLSGVFLVFAVWAAIGFTYPSTPLPTLLNDMGKILCFVVSITLFTTDRRGKTTEAIAQSPSV